MAGIAGLKTHLQVPSTTSTADISMAAIGNDLEEMKTIDGEASPATPLNGDHVDQKVGTSKANHKWNFSKMMVKTRKVLGSNNRALSWCKPFHHMVSSGRIWIRGTLFNITLIFVGLLSKVDLSLQFWTKCSQ